MKNNKRVNTLMENKNPITDIEKRIICQLELKYKWPKGSVSTLHYAVHDSYIAYIKWQHKFHKLLFTNPRLYHFHSHLGDIYPIPETLVIDWFTYIHERIAWRRDFSGDLTHHIWSPVSRWWQAQGLDYAVQWANDPKLWTQLMDLMED